MKIPTTICMAAALCLVASAGVYAAGMNQANVTRDWEDIVAPAQQQAYEAGEKDYNQCLAQHGFKYAVSAVTHSTGDTYQYSYTMGPVTWADYDTAHNESSACASLYNTEVNPHLTSETNNFETTQPDLSRMPQDLTPYVLVDVVHFWLKPGMAANDAFTKSVKQIYAAENKTNWPVYSEMEAIVAGGPGAADYELDVFYKNWADYGAAPNYETMLVNAYGKKKADAILKAGNDSISKEEEHIDRVDTALSYTPSGNSTM